MCRERNVVSSTAFFMLFTNTHSDERTALEVSSALGRSGKLWRPLLWAPRSLSTPFGERVGKAASGRSLGPQHPRRASSARRREDRVRQPVRKLGSRHFRGASIWRHVTVDEHRDHGLVDGQNLKRRWVRHERVRAAVCSAGWQQELQQAVSRDALA